MLRSGGNDHRIIAFDVGAIAIDDDFAFAFFHTEELVAVFIRSNTATLLIQREERRKGKSLGIANVELVAPAFADDDDHKEKTESFLDEALEEKYEFFGNLLLIFVGLHVSYLLLFKRPLAKFMLFVPKRAINTDKKT